jgi:hypothetical protein
MALIYKEGRTQDLKQQLVICIKLWISEIRASVVRSLNFKSLTKLESFRKLLIPFILRLWALTLLSEKKDDWQV